MDPRVISCDRPSTGLVLELASRAFPINIDLVARVDGDGRWGGPFGGALA